MLLQANDLSKSYGSNIILNHIDFQISERERIGLVGVNGAGKSTLLRILSGNLSYDSGQIHKAKETTIGYLAQNSGLSGQRTIWEEMQSVFKHLYDMEQQLRELERQIAEPETIDNPAKYEEISTRYSRLSDEFRMQGGYEIETKIRSVLHGMGFAQMAEDTPIQHLSGGQKTRLALARLLLSEPDILMLDEPTNHLDLPTLTWLESYLKTYPGAILIVSHDRYFLDAVVNTIYEIDRTKAKRYTGNYSRFIEQKAAQFEVELRQYKKQQDEISRMEDFIRRNIARASTSNRAKSRRKFLERMDRLEQPQGDHRRASFRFEIERTTGKEVLKVSGLSYAYADESMDPANQAEPSSQFNTDLRANDMTAHTTAHNESTPPLLDDINFQINRGEAVALIGANGTGKSTLLKLLVGQLTPASGEIEWGTNVNIAYYDQEQRNLNPTNTVLDEVWNAYPHLEEVTIRTVLGNFLFSGEDVLKKISTLSGGEKARVSLAKLMLQKANVLVLDEPTNHLDLYSKEVLESALIDYEGTLLFVSHDRYFLNKLADRIIELTPEGIHHFLGNFDDYVEKKEEIEQLEKEKRESTIESSSTAKHRTNNQASTNANHDANTNNSSASNDYETMKRMRQMERNRKRKLEKLEQQISEIEQEIVQLETSLTLPEIYEDYVQVQQINEQIEEKRNQLEQAYAEWESLL